MDDFPGLPELETIVAITSDCWLEWVCDPQKEKKDLLHARWESSEDMVKGLGEGHKWAHRLMAFNGPSAWSLDAINDAMRSRLLKHRKVVENHPAFKKLQANTHFKIAEARFNDKSGAKRTSHPFSYYRFIFVTCYSLAWFLIQSDKQMRFSPRPLREIRTAQKQLNSLEASFAHLRIDKKTDFIDLGFLLGAYEADHLDTAKKVRRKPRVDASYPQREFLRVASNGLRTQCGDSIPPNIRVSILRNLCALIEYQPDQKSFRAQVGARVAR